MCNRPSFGGEHSHALAVNSGLVLLRVQCTPLQWVSVPLWVGRSIPWQRGRVLCPSLWHGGYLPISLPPFCLALPTMTQFSDWSHSSSGSLSANINGYRCHSLCLTYVFLPKFAAKSLYLCVFTHPWWMLQEMSMVEATTSCFFTPGKLYW